MLFKVAFLLTSCQECVLLRFFYDSIPRRVYTISMKPFLYLLFALCAFPVSADGIFIEYVTLDFYRGFDNASFGTVQEMNPRRGFAEIRMEESGDLQRFHVAEEETYPGEWTIVFEYWAAVSLWDLEQGRSYICLPQVQGKDTLFLEDTEWNRRKVHLYAQGNTPETAMKDLSSSSLRDYLKDPDLSLYAYSLLQERGELGQEDILDGLWGYSFDLLAFLNGPTLFHRHMEELDEREKVDFFRAMMFRLETDYQSSPAGMLDVYFRERELKPEDLYIDFCSLYFRSEKNTGQSNGGFYNLIQLYQRGVSLERLMPALESWAFELPEGYDANQYDYTIKTLLQSLSPQDRLKLQDRWEDRLESMEESERKRALSTLLSAQ